MAVKRLPFLCDLCLRRPIAHQVIDGHAGVSRDLCRSCYRVWMGMLNAKEGIQFTFHGNMSEWLAVFAPANASVLSHLQALKAQMERLMAVSQAIQALATRLDAATNEIAADLKKLRDTLATGAGPTPEDLALLDSNVKRLEDMGVDPVDPVPEPEPPVVPPVE